MHACMYVCMHVCMYACMHSCMYVCISRQKNTVFPAFSQRGRPKTSSFSRFSAKGCRKPKPAKKPAGGIEPGTPVLRTPAPRRLRLVERHQIAPRYVGDPPPKTKNLRNRRRAAGGVRGGGYPLSSSKYPTRRAMSADKTHKGRASTGREGKEAECLSLPLLGGFSSWTRRLLGALAGQPPGPRCWASSKPSEPPGWRQVELANDMGGARRCFWLVGPIFLFFYLFGGAVSF